MMKDSLHFHFSTLISNPGGVTIHSLDLKSVWIPLERGKVGPVPGRRTDGGDSGA